MLPVLLLLAVLQTEKIINPTAVVFTVSPDHNVVDLGQPILTSYVLEIMRPDSTLVQAIDLGKPTLPTGGDYMVDLSALRSKFTMTPGDYVLRIGAIGPGGAGWSPISNPFVLAIKAPTAPTFLRLSGPVIPK